MEASGSARDGCGGMRRWSPPVAVPIPEVFPKESSVFSFKCVSCLGACDVLFDGCSYCQGCLKEKMRVGR